MKLEELKCVDKDNDIDKYLSFCSYVKSKMEHPEWLGDFLKEEVETILASNGKLFEYYEGDTLVCSMLYIPSNDKTLAKHNIKYSESIVGSCGPIMVNPSYVGNGLQLQMLNRLDEYCKSIGQEYIFTKVEDGNNYSINNFIKANYDFVESYSSKHGGMRNVYLKKLK